MKRAFVLFAIFALFAFGLSPPVQSMDIDQYDQTEILMDITNDVISVNLPVIEDSPALVLKYPTMEINYVIEARIENLMLASKYSAYFSNTMTPISKTMRLTCSNTSGLFRPDTGELDYRLHTY